MSCLKELRNYKTKVIFVSATKIGEDTTNISKLPFFTTNLHFVTSNQISTFRKLNLLLSSSIYFVFLPLEMQKRLKQLKVCHAFSYFVWKETTHKPLKVAKTPPVAASKQSENKRKELMIYFIKSIMALNSKHNVKLQKQRYRSRNPRKQEDEKLKHGKTKTWFYQKNRWKMETFINPYWTK